jgi:hypothetical protein
MKVKQCVGKVTFVPITITLETPDELDALLAGLTWVNPEDLGNTVQESFLDNLFDLLDELKGNEDD